MIARCTIPASPVQGVGYVRAINNIAIRLNQSVVRQFISGKVYGFQRHTDWSGTNFVVFLGTANSDFWHPVLFPHDIFERTFSIIGELYDDTALTDLP